MVDYNLSHLTQHPSQAVGGPIQDDEALLLFAMIRAMRLKRVLEIGGLGGYSATNFLAAMGPSGIVYTLDLNKVPKVSDNHITIQKDVMMIDPSDVESQPLDLVFFDCHYYDGQMHAYHALKSAGIITDNTIIALHDTNLMPTDRFASEKVEGGWLHIKDEARMVNQFKLLGYDIACFHPDMKVHFDPAEDLPWRWGLTIAKRFKPLPTGN